MTPWLSDVEIDDLCDGLRSNAAKVRYLRSQGLNVTQKPNGRPLIFRAHAETVLSGLQTVAQAAPNVERVQPNRAAMLALFGKSRWA